MKISDVFDKLSSFVDVSDPDISLHNFIMLYKQQKL